MSFRFRNALFATSALVPLGLAPAWASPTGARVVGGQATVQGQGTANVTVKQSTDRAIINWKTFNIGAGETTRFVQPRASSIALNRVTGGLGPSEIYGRLSANGRIFVVNPDGILVGPGAKIDTAGFLATTHDIKNENFMAGRYRFSIPGRPEASVVNHGMITAQDSGFAALVAPGIRNTGTITATLGKISLASGTGFSLDFYGDKLITLNVGDLVAATVKDVATGQPLEALVKNEGKLKADGGRVELTAAAARTVVDSVINNTGVIEATSIGQRGGMIVLGAATASNKPADAPSQAVKVSGTLSAAGKNTGDKGGTIVVTGEAIALAGASFDASGRDGGGTVLVGGDWAGGKPTVGLVSNASAKVESHSVPTATATVVDRATTIDASATDRGNGGKIIVWADQDTTFSGTANAKGGANSGDGGFVETSGRQRLAFDGAINVSAPKGQSGTLLLDPLNTTIASVGAWIVTPSAIQKALLSGNVIVTTGTGGSEAGDITVAENISWASANALTVSAHRNVAVNANITNSGGAAVNLRADSTGTGVGTVSFASGATVSTSGAVSIFYNPSVNSAGSIVNATSYVNPTEDYSANVAGGGTLTQYMLVNTVYDLQNVQNNLSGKYALGKNIDASATATWNGGTGFLPIGTFANPFTGQLIGGDPAGGVSRTIDRLTISSPAALVGLFGYIGASGAIMNLNLSNVSVRGTFTTGILPFNPTLGGIPGLNGGQFIGALAAQNDGAIKSVSVSGSVSAAAWTWIGGLVGWNQGSLIRSHSSGTVSASPGVLINGVVGGLVGENFGTIFQSHSEASVSGVGSIGGLVGENVNAIAESFAIGPVTLYGLGPGLAGLVGANLATGVISQSYARGVLTADPNGVGSGSFDPRVGGLVGFNEFGSVVDSYAANLIVVDPSSTVPMPAINGFIAYGEGAVSRSYWDTQTSGLTTSGISSGATGLTTAQFKAGLPTGFDNTVWGISGSVNSGYPHLQWQTASTPSTPTTTLTGGPPVTPRPPPPPTTVVLPQDFFGMGQITNLTQPIDTRIALSTPPVLTDTITPTTAQALEAAHQLLQLVEGCQRNCLQGVTKVAVNALVTKVLEESEVVPRLSSQPQRYQIVVAGVGIVITVVAIAAPAAAATAATVGLVFVVSELLVRPIIGSG